MSYILDALRKSEQKRGSLSLPVTAGHQHQAHSAKDHRIHRVLAALFIAAGSAWFIMQAPEPEMISATATHQPDAEPKTLIAATASRTAQPEPLQMTAPQATEQPEQQPQIQKARIPQSKPDAEHIVPVMPAQTTPAPDAVRPEITSIPPSLLTDEPEPALAIAHIPGRAELTLKQQQALPAISIAGHIYDENPSGRMVIINGRLRREKQGIGDGLMLEEITADGVILNHRGIIFRMGIFD